ncbi:MAG: adenylyltransferase/cytidyltransferase family protein [Taibaiella sp.]|nr:adenylyltransferase/cytidyltransferase family protein [Taibaiella sp.]
MEKLQWIQNKILSREDTLRQCNIWRASGQKIVFTNGCFDILHYGHYYLLAEAAQRGNKLVLALNTDASVQRLKGPDRPVNNEHDRAFQAASLMFVDAVCFFDESTPMELIELLDPDVLVKGGDYNIKQVVGADYVMDRAGIVLIVPFVDGYSTTSLISRIKEL